MCNCSVLSYAKLCLQRRDRGKRFRKYRKTITFVESKICAEGSVQIDSTITEHYANGYIQRRSFKGCNGKIATLMPDTMFLSDLSLVNKAITVTQDTSFIGGVNISVESGITGELKVYYAGEEGASRKQVHTIRLTGLKRSYRVSSSFLRNRGLMSF